MLPSREAVEEISFPDVLENQELPIMLKVSKDCKLHGRTVLEQGQHITVIDRSSINMLCGRDWKNKKIRFGKEQVVDYQMEIVEEMHPSNLEELRAMVEKCNFFQSKTKFYSSLHTFESFETFQFSHFLDDTYESLAVVTDKGMTIIDSEILFDYEAFVLVRIKEVTNIRDFIRNFKSGQPPVICFRDPGTGTLLPFGNIQIQSVANYEIAYIVTAIKGGRELKYETFPIDKRIQFYRVRTDTIPKHVQVFGAYNSNSYQEKLGEIKSVMKYEFHSPRFYAFLIVENHTYVPSANDTSMAFQRPSQLELKTSIYSSIRKGFNKLTAKKPSANEECEGKLKLNSRVSDSVLSITKHNNERVEVSQRSSSESDCAQQRTLKSAENPVYDMEEGKKITIPMSIKSKEQPIINGQQRGRVIKPVRPVSFDTKMIFPMDALLNSEAKEYEKPFNQQSPFGRPSYIKDENIKFLNRQSTPLPTPIRVEPLNDSSYSVSPPWPVMQFLDQEGMDSGVDSPDDQIKNHRQLGRMFRSRSDVVGSDLDISWPYNFEHVNAKKKSQGSSPLYDIPRRKLLESMNNFPKLNQMQLKRCKSESALDENTVYRNQAPIYEEPDYEFVKGVHEADINHRQKVELHSISQIKQYSIQQMLQLLITLNLKKHVKTFKRQLVNGALLVRLTETTLCSDMGMTAFEARKLYKYVHGWRPKVHNFHASTIDEIKRLDRTEWGYLDVQRQMQVIKLSEFGKFCFENLVDGTLLLDLQKNNLMSTLKDDGVYLNNVEMQRLEGYLNKDVLYDKDGDFLGKQI